MLATTSEPAAGDYRYVGHGLRFAHERKLGGRRGADCAHIVEGQRDGFRGGAAYRRYRVKD